jgi:hypothetical protein
MDLKAGSRWTSAVSDVEVVVVKAPDEGLALSCGGAEMLPHGDDKTGGEVEAGLDDDIAVGKRFSNESGDFELLVTKGGKGSLKVGDEVLVIKGAKPLPSSD